ncbi:MAG: hypothetical protein H3C54_10210 [Taibaiella sp.]|nr:hypothetical protein [Taibaiella sp.]
MDYKIEDLDISKRLDELGIALPGNLTFFPDNFDTANAKDEFVFTDTMLDLSKIFRKDNSILIPALGQDTELYRSRKSSDIYLPAIFFGLSQITENPQIISISLNVLSNYVYDLCKGTSSKKTAHVDFYLETKERGKVKKLSYKGDVEGLEELGKVIKAMR